MGFFKETVKPVLQRKITLFARHTRSLILIMSKIYTFLMGNFYPLKQQICVLK